jgi:hypothetical protein
MPDLTAMEFEARDITPALPTSLIDEARAFVSGALFTGVMAVVGTVLVTAALMVAVVGSPLIVVAIAYAMVRRHRQERARAFAIVQTATS